MNERIQQLMENPRRGLFTIAWPMIFSMTFSVVLHLTDFFFVGGLGPEALAAVQLSFPLMFLLFALGGGVMIGTTALIARRLGEKNKKWAEETGLHGLLMGVILAVLFTIIGLTVIRPLASGLGGGPLVSQLAGDYLGIIFAGSIVFMMVFTMQAILQGEGDTKTAMKFSVLFTLANMVLDPIFIYGFGLGVSGAALATVLAEAISMALLFWYIVASKRSYLQIKPREFIYTPPIIKNILRVGIPSGFTQIGLSIAIFGTNLIIAGFGDLAVAGFGIGFRVDSLAILPILGLGAGVIPMVGYFRGAKDYEGARHISRLSIKMSLAFTAAIGVLVFLLAGIFPIMFTNDPSVIAIAADYMRVMAFAYPFIGVTIIAGSTFQGLGRGTPGMIITLLRAVLVAIPASYVLAYHTSLGLFGVLLGITLSSVTGAAFSFAWIESYFRKLCEAGE